MSRSTRSAKTLLGGTTLTIALVLILVVYRAIIGAGPLFPITVTPVPPTVTAQPGGSEWYSVYFTDPLSPAAGSFQGGPDQQLVAAIGAARLSVDVAIYDLDLRSVRDALIEAHRRGVAVRVVAESDNLDEDEFQDLLEAGIPVLGDRREGLMHNKFVVIDRLEVWTGSMNFTVNDAYRNNNNLIRVRSTRLAENYLAEFEEMFRDDRFGPTSPADTPNPLVRVDGASLEVYFSPEDGTAARVVELIQGAQESVHFLAFSFTADDIATSMLERAHAGVTVTGVFEESQFRSNIGTEYGHLRTAGLDVRLDGNPRNMHHKVIVIDGQIVITGSYNFSASAERRNDENTVIIFDPQVAALYLAEFEGVYEVAQP